MLLRSVIPLQLMHSARFPFLGTFIMRPSFQVTGIVSEFQTSLIIGCSNCATPWASAFRISLGMLSGPGDLWFFKCLIAASISWVFGSLVSMRRGLVGVLFGRLFMPSFREAGKIFFPST
ncbi:hypothetical protein HHI36_020793 [Cryptolaemus montrouzieri]|uniref:Uncharacterized protein n=1 Tax=Cryptolaemus montrouzieri TaxID=559131 RepID=A0ABD2NC51_9CUCU